MRIFIITIMAFITLAGETGVAFAHAYPVQEIPKAGAVLKAAPLPPGTYKVTWHALSTDGHRTQGSYEFTEAP